MKKIAFSDPENLKKFSPEIVTPPPQGNSPLVFVIEFIDNDGERKVEQFGSADDRLKFIDANNERISSPKVYAYPAGSQPTIPQE